MGDEAISRGLFGCIDFASTCLVRRWNGTGAINLDYGVIQYYYVEKKLHMYLYVCTISLSGTVIFRDEKYPHFKSIDSLHREEVTNLHDYIHPHLLIDFRIYNIRLMWNVMWFVVLPCRIVSLYSARNHVLAYAYFLDVLLVRTGAYLSPIYGFFNVVFRYEFWNTYNILQPPKVWQSCIHVTTSCRSKILVHYLRFWLRACDYANLVCRKYS